MNNTPDPLEGGLPKLIILKPPLVRELHKSREAQNSSVKNKEITLRYTQTHSAKTF